MTDTYGAWAIARLLQGYPLDTISANRMPGHWREMLGVMISNNGGDRETALQTYLKHRPDLDPDVIWGHVLAADPLGDCPTDEEEQLYHVQPDVPALPDDCLPSPDQERAAGRVARWLDQFTAWANARADRSPEEFNEAAGIWSAGLAIARRLVLRLGHGDIYPNLYLLTVAPTTLYAKSVAMDCAAAVLSEAVPYLLLPRDMSPEAMIDEMAGKVPPGFEDLPAQAREMWEIARRFAGQRGQFMDEASSLFSGFSRDYNRGLAEFYLLMYDAGRSYTRRTKQGGMVVINNPCLSFYGGTTPVLFKEAAGKPKHWGSGLWVRFSFLTPTRAPRWTAPRQQENPIPEGLITRLKMLAEEHLGQPEFGKPVQPRSVAMAREAFAAYQSYDRAMYEILLGRQRPDERLFGTYGRMSTRALKIALILAALDWYGDGGVTITAGHWYRAQTIAEKWRASTHRLLAWLSRDSSDEAEQRLISMIGATAAGITGRNIARRTGMKRDELDVLLRRLVQDGVIEPRKSSGRGRPTVKYHLALGNPE